MYLCLFEDDHVDHLLPLVYTRAVYDLRLGLRTLGDTTREAFGEPATLLHARSLVAAVTAQENDLLVNRVPDGLDVLFVNGRFVAEEGPVLERLQGAVHAEETARVFVQGDEVIAAWVPDASTRYVEHEAITRATFEDLPEEKVENARLIGRLWHLVEDVGAAVRRDYEARLGDHNILQRSEARVHESATLVGAERIYTGAGAVVAPGAILNAEDGPIYIDDKAVVQEGAVLRGPLYVGRGAQIRSSAAVDESAIGPESKVGGEVHDCILHARSNKAHAGFLGHSYLGGWCNLGADTNNSNLKNDYGSVALYDYATGALEDSGQQFLGLFMGDHSKCGINTMFNTGTVVGVFCNLFGAGYMPKHVPSFSWGGADKLVTYRLEKALRVADTVLARRDVPFTDADRALLTAIFEQSQGR